MKMYTDPQRVSADTPGDVVGNPVFIYHEHFNEDKDEVKELMERYRLGKVGDVEVKRRLIIAINNLLEPIRSQRESYRRHPDIVKDILVAGADRMQEESNETLDQVRQAMGTEIYQPRNLNKSYLIPPENVLDGLAFM